MLRLVLILSLIVGPPAVVAENAPRWDNSQVAGAGLPEFRFELQPAFPGIVFPSAVHTRPYSAGGERRLLIASDKGALYSIPSARPATLPEPSYQLADHFGTPVRLYSTLFDREFPERPFLYVFCNTRKPAPARNRILRFELREIDTLQLGLPVELINWESSGHDGGDMAWGPDGMLYLTAGDRSAPGDPNNWGQRTDDIFGSVLRIDVHSAEPYAVPPDNPFVGAEGVRPEIWAYGLRNPWRMTFHPERGELWVGDNGDESWEMVHLIKKGANAGWSAFEGSHVFRPSNKLAGPNPVQTPALVQQPHSEMRSVIGGMFYRGEALADLSGHYLYGCYFTKQLWAFSYRDGEVGAPFLLAGGKGQVVSFIEGHDREPLITCHDGNIYRLVARTAPPSSRPWPERLSDTGLFGSTSDHAPAAGVFPYWTNAGSWADGATRQHFVAVAEGKPMQAQGGRVDAGKSFRIPEGSMVGQTLSLGGRRVETQLLYFDGTWRGFSYRWDADGADATLVPPEGEEAEIAGQRWRFPSRAECMTCHTHRSNFALTLKVPQLDRRKPGGGNQLDAWLAAGLLAENGALKAERDKPTPDPYDASLDLEARARSYLDLNCAHCHRETGLGGRASFQLLASLPLEETGIVDAKPVVGLLGKAGARVLAPGEPDKSELLARMARRGPGQMPLIGSHRIDEEGVALIREWIRSLGEE